MNKEKIISELKTHNLTRVAEKIGVHRQTLYRLVNEKTNPSPMLEKSLIKFLKMEEKDDT